MTRRKRAKLIRAVTMCLLNRFSMRARVAFTSLFNIFLNLGAIDECL